MTDREHHMRMRTAPSEIGRQEQTLCQYAIQHLPRADHMMPGHEPEWFTTWAGEEFWSNAPLAHEMELEAHKALDRASTSTHWADTRLLLQRITTRKEVVRIPAMWEEETPA